jgi:hypothetical protein
MCLVYLQAAEVSADPVLLGLLPVASEHSGSLGLQALNSGDSGSLGLRSALSSEDSAVVGLRALASDDSAVVNLAALSSDDDSAELGLAALNASGSAGPGAAQVVVKSEDSAGLGLRALLADADADAATADTASSGPTRSTDAPAAAPEQVRPEPWAAADPGARRVFVYYTAG